MSKILLIILILLFFMGIYLPVRASDKNITTSTYRSSNGSTTIITNRAAKDEAKFIESNKKNGVYKSHRPYAKTRRSSSSSDNKSYFQRTYNASESSGILEPIIVNLADGSELDLSPIILREAKKNNVDPMLIRTIIKFESGFYPYAVSPVGAGGLMQLMPDTARGLGVTDVFSPHQNIAGGTLYIRRQLDAFNNNLPFALAAYNAGPGAVLSYGGIPPYAETVNYVNRILQEYSGSGKPKNDETKQTVNTKRKKSVNVYSTLDRMRMLTAPK